MTSEEYGSTRIWKKTLKKLKLIAALMGTTIVAVIDDMADERLKHLKEKESK